MFLNFEGYSTTPFINLGRIIIIVYNALYITGMISPKTTKNICKKCFMFQEACISILYHKQSVIGSIFCSWYYRMEHVTVINRKILASWYGKFTCFINRIKMQAYARSKEKHLVFGKYHGQWWMTNKYGIRYSLYGCEK